MCIIFIICQKEKHQMIKVKKRKLSPKTITVFEGDNVYETAINEGAEEGDTIAYSSNNQLGSWSGEIKKINKTNKEIILKNLKYLNDDDDDDDDDDDEGTDFTFYGPSDDSDGYSDYERDGMGKKKKKKKKSRKKSKKVKKKKKSRKKSKKVKRKKRNNIRKSKRVIRK